MLYINRHIIPHIFVWGSCFWFCIPGSSSAFSSSALLHTLSPHTLSTHTLSPHTLSPHIVNTHFVHTHTLSPHTLSPHIVNTHFVNTHFVTKHFVHTHFVHTHFVPHTLCHHTLCPHTLCHQTLCPHTLCPHTLCHHTLCEHTLSTHTLSTRTLSPNTLSTHTLSTPSFHVAGVAQTHIHRRFVWQAWHSWYCVARLVPDLSPGAPRHFGVAGVAQPDIHLRFTWQAWHNLTIHHRFAWQAWHSWYCVARLVRICRPGRRATLRGRRGTWWHPPSFHVAGVAQTHIHRRFAWQAWHSWYCVARLVRICRPGRRATLRGRRGTWWLPPSFHVAGVAQTHIHRRFVWQAWHSWYCVARLVRICRPGRRVTLRGRRGTWWHPPSFHVADVAQTHIHRRFAWQGVALMVLCGALGPDLSPGAPRHFAWQAWHNLTSTSVSCGRRGTNSHPPSFCVEAWHSWYCVARLVRICRPGGAASLCVAGVALGDIHLRFTWQTWHKLTSTVVLRGRRGTHGTVWRAWSDLSPGAPRHFAWQAWHLGDIHLRFTWQYNKRKVKKIKGKKKKQKKKKKRGTNSHPPSFCVAGVTLMVLCGALGPDLSPGAPRHFAWQRWHLVTSTFVSRGRRGTNSHPLSFCVAGVAPALTHPLSHPLCHTPSFAHHLSHPTLSPTIFHAPSFTHHIVTHHLWHTLFYTPSL